MKRSLSEMQREKPKEPFIITVAGDVDVEFVNPKHLHWTKLVSLDDESPAHQIEALIEDPTQFAAFRDDPDIDGEVLEWVMEQWRTHYGLGGPGDSPGSTGS